MRISNKHKEMREEIPVFDPQEEDCNLRHHHVQTDEHSVGTGE